MSIHDGHRKRIKDRFLKYGLDGFEEHQILEFLLFYAIPRRDTNEIAHNLIARYGSLAAVLDAEVHDLAAVEGMGERSAVFLSFIRETYKRYDISKEKNRKVMHGVADYGPVLRALLAYRKNEMAYLLCMNGRSELIGTYKIAEGTVDSVYIPVRNVVAMALSVNAVSVVLGHNHPGGFALPSDADTIETDRIAEALSSVGVVLIDHVVVENGEYISLGESNLFQPR